MWSVQDAKNRLSAVIDAALASSPQVISRRGKPSVVVVSVEHYERLARAAIAQRPSFIDHLLAQPQDEEEQEPPRLRAVPRDVEL